MGPRRKVDGGVLAGASGDGEFGDGEFGEDIEARLDATAQIGGRPDIERNESVALSSVKDVTRAPEL